MEFLKEILGDALYAQVEQAMNAYNSSEANKDKQVKLANLSSGEYVGKGEYDALQVQLDGKTTELDTANGVIAELKKGTKGNEELQGKITTYENTVAQLQAELAKTRLDNAIQLALRDAKAVDPDYLAYKLHEKYKPEELTLDDPRTAAWLRGEEINAATAQSGWCAVLVDGFPLGGGKASGGRIKNHYPKGLRSLQ